MLCICTKSMRRDMVKSCVLDLVLRDQMSLPFEKVAATFTCMLCHTFSCHITTVWNYFTFSPCFCLVSQVECKHCEITDYVLFNVTLPVPRTVPSMW
jgi:hypothetical protein